MPLGNASRSANILEPMTPRRSTVSKTTLYSNSFVAHRDYPIHRRLWVLKAHDRKSQASNLFCGEVSGYSEIWEWSNCTYSWLWRSGSRSSHDKKGNDLLIGSRGTDLYSITLQDTSSPNLICLMAKATLSQAWLWHRRLSHLNFDTLNLLSKNDIVIGLPKLKFVKDYLCSSCELGKTKRKSFQTKTTPSSKRWLQLLHMDLCGPMRVESINGKKYVLAIVDDYYRYTWTHFLRSTDETPEVLIDFLRLVQRGLHAQSRTYRVFKKRTKVIVETIHVNVDELPHMASDHVTGIVTTSNELDFLFSLMFDELLNGFAQIMSKSSSITSADAPNHGQQQNTTPLNTPTTPEPTCQVPTQAPTITSTENINQAEMIKENAQVKNDELINIFCTPLESDGEMCMFALTVSQTEPKNIKEAMADSAWIESIQEELHQFDRLDEGVDFEESFAPSARLEAVQLFIVVGTPMAMKHLDDDLSGTSVDQTKYQSMVGALMYLTASRLDIVRATCYCARYQAKPTEKHLTAVKQIFRYKVSVAASFQQSRIHKPHAHTQAFKVNHSTTRPLILQFLIIKDP
nr:retrovirus-related Pol polyprotein from transposon TNT 1-94 [Tanacetum cinerariifolium]